MKPPEPLYGLMVEFDDDHKLVEAAQRVYGEGYRQVDAYTPFPVEGLPEALGRRRTGVPLLMLIAGLSGAAAGYGMQYWMMAVDYPYNIGGRPLNSWPMFIPVTFEVAILTTAIVGVIGTLFMNGLPRPYHPVFNVPQFARASIDRFFLSVESSDPKFDPQQTRTFLEGLHGLGVFEVES